jgi:hypothetical protein
LRQSYDDAYRVIPDADRWAWWARCPCYGGHTMLVMDLGDDRMPGIACRHGCDSGDIRRAFGLYTPEEAERHRRLVIFREEFLRYREWVAARKRAAREAWS